MKIIKEENVSHETLKNIFYVKKHVSCETLYRLIKRKVI